jgi:hypothetical protein
VEPHSAAVEPHSATAESIGRARQAEHNQSQRERSRDKKPLHLHREYLLRHCFTAAKPKSRHAAAVRVSIASSIPLMKSNKCLSLSGTVEVIIRKW